jgi:NAD(P)-dependent dehydrogenase (short-subunit alcohol dehydrogenase family)
VGLLTGKTALVTGGSRGIGRVIVERLARDGAAVVFSFVRHQPAAEEVVAVVAAAGGNAHAVQADLGRLGEVRRLFDQAERHLGGLDILVNNASVAVTTSVAEATEQAYDRVMAVNTKGTFFALQQAARRLRDSGRIVNLSSINTVLPAPGWRSMPPARPRSSSSPWSPRGSWPAGGSPSTPSPRASPIPRYSVAPIHSCFGVCARSVSVWRAVLGRVAAAAMG